MQFCKVEIKLGGDMLNTVIKNGVSVPEIVLLRQIHGGADSVRVIEIEDARKVQNSAELERLRREYDTAKNEDGKRVVDMVFPGAGIKLAEQLSDIGDAFEGGAEAQNGEIEPVPEDELAGAPKILNKRAK
jgi:hypothetical protein